jgi:UDP-4-amino-4,6-dideoxy-N-acetyl-beta-L-altrosamine N-acetyltransferase
MANMHQNKTITWDEHLNWFSNLKTDTEREFWVLHQNERPIGILNFSDVGKPRVEWGCYLGETNVWPGSGILLEVAALERATRLKNAISLSAEVLSFNKSAIGMHRLFEYPLIETLTGGVREGEHYQKLCFEYPLLQWNQKKAKVLSKLPKSLRNLVDKIEFREGI